MRSPCFAPSGVALIFQVGTPYLRDKADKAYTALSGGQAAQLGLLSADDEARGGLSLLSISACLVTDCSHCQPSTEQLSLFAGRG